MSLDSTLDLWPPGHFELGFFASQIGRLEIECSALGFSYVRGKPRSGQLAKMCVQMGESIPTRIDFRGKGYHKVLIGNLFIIRVVPSSASCQLPCPPDHQNNFEMYFWYRRRL